MSELLIIIGLILLNGLFSMSETALISARKNRLTQESKQGNQAARTALEIASNPDRFLSTVQIGITLIGILTGLYSGATISGYFARILTGLGVMPEYADEIAQITIVFVVTYLSIVVGELVPKRIALSSSVTVAKLVARPMKLLSTLALPFVWLLSVSTGMIVKLLHLRPDDDKVTEGDVRQIIENGAASGEVMKVEKDIMTRALALGNQRVSSIMTCRKDVVTLKSDMTTAEIRDTLSSELHDSYPVIDVTTSDVIGTVSLKALILTLDRPEFKLDEVIAPGRFIPENMNVYDALEHLKNDRLHCLIVCDEFGTMQGVVTLNDILDGLVGATDRVVADSYIAGHDKFNAQCPLLDFLTYYDCCDLYEPAGYTTLGGLILELTRRLPSAGDHISWNGFEFEILDMQGSRIGCIAVRHDTKEIV